MNIEDWEDVIDEEVSFVQGDPHLSEYYTPYEYLVKIHHTHQLLTNLLLVANGTKPRVGTMEWLFFRGWDTTEKELYWNRIRVY